MFDHRPRIGRETGHGAPDVGIDLHDLFDGRRFEEGGLDAFLYGENRTVRRGDSDRGGSEFDSFHGVFDLGSSGGGGARR